MTSKFGKFPGSNMTNMLAFSLKPILITRLKILFVTEWYDAVITTSGEGAGYLIITL